MTYYHVTDIYLAAYLQCLRIPLARIKRDPATHRVTFSFLVESEEIAKAHVSAYLTGQATVVASEFAHHIRDNKHVVHRV